MNSILSSLTFNCPKLSGSNFVCTKNRRFQSEFPRSNLKFLWLLHPLRSWLLIEMVRLRSKLDQSSNVCMLVICSRVAAGNVRGMPGQISVLLIRSLYSTLTSGLNCHSRLPYWIAISDGPLKGFFFHINYCMKNKSGLHDMNIYCKSLRGNLLT